MRSIVVVIVLGAFGALGTFACGSDDNAPEDSPTPTVRAGGGGGQPSPADPRTATATPRPPDATATPQPSPTSTEPPASPTPAMLAFTQADASDGTTTPRSSGPLGIVYADAGIGANTPTNRLEAFAFVNIGINEHPAATAWLLNHFRAPGEGSAITAQISSEVNWKGILAGNGAAGTGATVTITLSVLDGTRTVASEVVHTLSQRESALTVGGFDDIGGAPTNLQVVLVPGRLYSLQLTLSCEAFSGLIGVGTHCIFGPSDVYEDGYVIWGQRDILFAD